MDKKHLPFWLFVIATACGLTLPALLRDGMFMDGLLYTTVAKNLGNGYGTFWFPKLSETWYIQGLYTFHEHPPLVFWIQSLFFRVLGNSMYTERFYIFFTGCITATLIVCHWRLIFREDRKMAELAWLPVFFWIITPICFWSYQNNMQENTMGIFILASVYFGIKGFMYRSNTVLYLIITGIFIFLASFSKGLPGFFPISFVMVYWLVYRDFSFIKAILYSLILVVVPALIYAMLMLNHEAYSSLSFYIVKRAFHRVSNAGAMSNRFYSAGRLFQELLPILLLSAALWGITKRKIKTNIPSYYKEAAIFILLGIMGSFPLMLTRVQKGFYLVPSIPFYAIGFALLIGPGIRELLCKLDVNSKNFKLFKRITVVLFIAVAVGSFLQIGKTSRHKERLYDVHLIGKQLPDRTTVSASEKLYHNWSLHAYFMRYYNTSLDYKKQHAYFLIKKDEAPPSDTKYRRIDLPTKVYDLYKILNERDESNQKPLSSLRHIEH